MSDANVTQLYCPYTSVEGYAEHAMLSSDIHWDDPNCERDLLRRHLDQVAELNGGVFIFGDLFDVMQGPKDPRASKHGARPEHLSDAYFDDVVGSAMDWFEPWAPWIRVVGYGNHETSVMKHYGTDLIARFVNGLNERDCGAEIEKGGYDGWVVWKFEKLGAKTGKAGQRKSVKLYYNHGAGGGSAVSKGATKASRRASYLPDADIVYGGHIHEAWEMEIPRLRLSSQGVVHTDVQFHLQGPAYSNDRDSGMSWAVTKEFAPKPLGAWLVEMTIRNGLPVISNRRLR